MRVLYPNQYNNRPAPTNSSQSGAIKSVLFIGLLIICVFAFNSVRGHALGSAAEIKSGVSGYCLDVHDNDSAPGTLADSYKCNGSDAQSWSVNGTTIEHASDLCLSLANNATASGSLVDIEKCDQAPGQVWLSDNNSYQNPNSGLCLSIPGSQTGSQLVINSCSNDSNETWTPGSEATDQAQTSCAGSQRQKVVCYAEQDYRQWQSGTPSHESLLNTYTDGAPYEEWCADFVSYVYKQAGYPFTNGNTNGWDENIADQVQYMGYTKHSASDYTPQPGDVAYFDYPGGHVEIVVSGGPKPTFIYGNSATIDPSTGNGEMEANTITQKPNLGNVIYYLSPNN